ncbi:hypothetical protein ACOMHN_021522 [Nucella lapillus]
MLCTPTVIGMVGLPARGKSYIAKRLNRYLNWIGIKTAIFNVGQYRRQVTGNLSNNSFFAADNKEAQEIREKCAMMAINDAIQFLFKGGEVVLVDATNTTVRRRDLMKQRFTIDNPFHLFFVESVCNDQATIEANILEVKVGGPDYVGQDSESVVRDFMERIEHYRKVYEPLGGKGEEDVPYIQIIDKGAQFVANKPVGRLQSRVLFYLMKMCVLQRTIYFTRPGESSTDKNRQGGVSELTARGMKYAEEVKNFLRKEKAKAVQVWSCERSPSLQTASRINSDSHDTWPALTHTDNSRHETMTVRLEPVIMELEQTTNVVVISEEPVLKYLLAYFQGHATEDIASAAVPKHTMIKVASTNYGYSVDHVPLM